MIDRGFQEFDDEAFLIARLAQAGRSVTIGITDTSTRKDRIRQAIIDAGVASRIVRHPETFKQYFERHYGEPLFSATNTKEK